MTKRINHPAQNAKQFCKRLIATVLILLLIVMFIPSAIALGDESDAQIFEEEPPIKCILTNPQR